MCHVGSNFMFVQSNCYEELGCRKNLSGYRFVEIALFVEFQKAIFGYFSYFLVEPNTYLINMSM